MLSLSDSVFARRRAGHSRPELRWDEIISNMVVGCGEQRRIAAQHAGRLALGEASESKFKYKLKFDSGLLARLAIPLAEAKK
jgi:hypothetical protein